MMNASYHTHGDFDPGFLAAITAAVMDRAGRWERDEIRFGCPNAAAHKNGDAHPSARWHPAKAVWRCDACGEHGGALDLARRLGVPIPGRGGGGRDDPSVNGVTTLPGLTLATLAEAKHLPLETLRSHGCYDLHYLGSPAVGIPYYDQSSEVAATRFRLALSGERFRWKKGSKPRPYGIWLLPQFRRQGWVLVVEGESDSWTAWRHGLPALGVPGKSTWQPDWAALLDELDVYVWQEPDAEDFALRIGGSMPDAKLITAPEGVKDLSAAHVAGQDIPALLDRLKASAVPVATLLDRKHRADLAEAEAAAAPVLDAPDPLHLVADGIRALGYGGDLTPPLVTYLAATTRVLAVRPGAMLAHLLLIGPASAGKSYTVSLVLRLLPPAAYAVIDAGSPRVLIYDQADYRHRLLVYGEADSIPAGEDNPAASAIRNLLQENRLVYKVVARDPKTGAFGVQTVDKPGPTVLVTTATRSLGHQLNTRLFALDVADDANQMRAALAAQGLLEEDGAPAPRAELVAFQGYLQARAPWDVVVPFAARLANLLGRYHTANRVLRDYARLLALVKAVAVLRHRHRERDQAGRLIATVEDYATVRALVGHIYAVAAGGPSPAVRATVAAVGDLLPTVDHPSALSVATALGINKMTATRRINQAVRQGWLINDEDKRNRPYRLRLGDPMPETVGLPDPAELAASGNAVTPLTDGVDPPSPPEP